MHARPRTTVSFLPAFPPRRRTALRQAPTFRFPRIFGSYAPMPQGTASGTEPMAGSAANRLLRSLLRLMADHYLAALRSQTLAGIKTVPSMAEHSIIGWFVW